MKITQKDREAMERIISENYDTMNPTFEDDGFDPQDEEASVGVMELEVAPDPSVDTFNLGAPAAEVDNSDILIDLNKVSEYSQRLLELCNQTTFEPWMIAKLAKAADYVSDVYYNVSVEADFANSGVDQIGGQI